MLNRPEQGCLVMADVSGYTGYLAGTELDHAQDVLADLIGTVVGAFRPVLRLAKLEGDAGWTTMDYEFEVSTDGEDRTLVCELRAKRGTAWFAMDSLKLIRVK